MLIVFILYRSLTLTTTANMQSPQLISKTLWFAGIVDLVGPMTKRSVKCHVEL